MRYPKAGSEKERARFTELQRRLGPLYRRVFADRLAPRTVVVVPSLSLDADIITKIQGAPHYEERLLCLLMLLRMPYTRVVYATSVPIHATIIDYYLHLLAGVPHSHARQRLTLVACGESSSAPLTAKILANRSVLRRLRAAIGDPALAHLVCFNVSSLERTLSVRLGIPLYGCDPALADLGSKSSSRQIFRAAGVTMPDGFEALRDRQDVAAALAALKRRHRSLESAVVKLNDGFSGEGNARFRYRSGDADAHSEAHIDRRLPRRLLYEATDQTWERYAAKLAEMGGIVEAFVTGDEARSPSVQCRIDPRRVVEVVSTHEQVLGGRSGQVFVGCEFPADDRYRAELQDAGERVAEVLRDRGVLGRFGVDFVVVREDGRWSPYAIEINLRKGGTTHPFLMLDFLTDGMYDRETGVYRTPAGQARYYVATDNLHERRYLGLSPDDLVRIALEQRLHFHAPSQEGVVFHLIGALELHGKLGMVCIGADRDRARRLYGRTVEILNREGRGRARRRRTRHRLLAPGPT
ncbi:MAG: ATP-grasp domain-containing protein [Acidobacteria bacterium]|nr:ATP-grasp domain-containing protein [Acidobacteriota bacterium]